MKLILDKPHLSTLDTIRTITGIIAWAWLISGALLFLSDPWANLLWLRDSPDGGRALVLYVLAVLLAAAPFEFEGE